MSLGRGGGRVGDFLTSRRLALVLLLLLALLAVGGTFLTPAEAEKLLADAFGPAALPFFNVLGATNPYRGVPFISLLVLLALNIAFCTWRRFRRRLSSPGKAGAIAWVDALLHGAVIILLAGGSGKALWGFTGTQNLLVGVEKATVFDWSVKSEVPLGFTMVMRERVEDFYPLRARIGVRDRATGRKVALLEVMEGRGVTVREDLEVEVLGFDGLRQEVLLAAAAGGKRETVALAARGGEGSSVGIGPYTLSLVAYRRDLKKVRGLVAVLENGEVLTEQWLAVNDRIAYGGTSIFQTAWGEDAYGNPFIGVQVSRDPAAPLFWLGATLLSLTMPFFFYVRHRRRKNGE